MGERAEQKKGLISQLFFGSARSPSVAHPFRPFKEKHAEIQKQQGAAFGGATRGRALRARPLGFVVFVFLFDFLDFWLIFRMFAVLCRKGLEKGPETFLKISKMFQALFQGLFGTTRQTSGKSARNQENQTEIQKQQTQWGGRRAPAPLGAAEGGALLFYYFCLIFLISG